MRMMIIIHPHHHHVLKANGIIFERDCEEDDVEAIPEDLEVMDNFEDTVDVETFRMGVFKSISSSFSSSSAPAVVSGHERFLH